MAVVRAEGGKSPQGTRTVNQPRRPGSMPQPQAALLPANILSFQRMIGNQAVLQLLRDQELRAVASGGALGGTVAGAHQVTPVHDAAEVEADRVAQQVASRGGFAIQRTAAALDRGGAAPPAVARDIRGAQGKGTMLPDSLAKHMGQAMQADFSQVRVHTDSRADRLNRALDAEAFAHGPDLFFRRGAYRPDSQKGRQLVAHELTHVVQQGGDGVRRKPDGKGGPTVKQSLPGNRISLKRRPMRLDFVVMKRKDAQYGKIIGGATGMKGPQRDTYGHWWTEVGSTDTQGTFHPTASYGWWPSVTLGSIKQTIKGVPGSLNKGMTNDPHQGHTAPLTVHPVMNVDPEVEDYDAIRSRVVGAIHNFAHGYSGIWNWKLGAGKNCHTFQTKMKKKVGLKFKGPNRWLRDPQVVAQAQQEEDAARAAEQARIEEARPKPVIGEVELPGFLDLLDDRMRQQNMLRPGTRVGYTGVVRDKTVQIVVNHNHYLWTWTHDWERVVGSPYPVVYDRRTNSPQNLVADGSGSAEDMLTTEDEEGTSGAEMDDVDADQGILDVVATDPQPERSETQAQEPVTAMSSGPDSVHGDGEPDAVQEQIPLLPRQVHSLLTDVPAEHVPMYGLRTPTQVPAGKQVQIKDVMDDRVRFYVAGVSVLHEASLASFRAAL